MIGIVAADDVGAADFSPQLRCLSAEFDDFAIADQPDARASDIVNNHRLRMNGKLGLTAEKARQLVKQIYLCAAPHDDKG